MTKNYFQLFGLPETFELDTEKLTQIYRVLAAQCHPDKFAAQSAFEQKQAMMMSATVNEAYRILQNPLDRAAYLLQSAGIDADAPEHTAFAPEFLMQQMEWRETLGDARESGDAAALSALAEEVRTAQQEVYQALAAAFADKQWETAADYVRRGRFLSKMIQEIQAA